MGANLNAVVTGVFPNKIRIEVNKIEDFKISTEKLAVGSYLRISDSEDCAIIGIIENFNIEKKPEDENRKYILEAIPIGFLDPDGKFQRGGNNIAIPPTGVEPAKKADIQLIYDQIDNDKKFCFSSLSQDEQIRIPVNGDKFFNKHIAIVGSTGSGKSHCVAKIIQKAVEAKKGGYQGLNNSHIIIFDIHSEYKTAFPNAKVLDTSSLLLPYWLLNSEELQELFIDTEANDHNQKNVFKESVVFNKKKHNLNIDEKKITFDAPLKFSITEILQYVVNRNNERKDKSNKITWKDDPNGTPFLIDDTNRHLLFEKLLYPGGTAQAGLNGKLFNFISRIENKVKDKRLSFLLNERDVLSVNFKDVLEQFLSYKKGDESNVTIIDLSGVPFEVLSITVSLITRILFEFGYYLKKQSAIDSEIPILLVFEEAHKYVPKTDLSRYYASRISIERVAKEGRKYGVTLAIVSQRPSEISETIFSQCNNFLSMRLTNPQDQNYVKRLLPDSLGPLTESLPILESGEAIIIGDSIIMPSLVKVDECAEEERPSSTDIPYFKEWKEPWVNEDFSKITDKWLK